jgi:hyperosmotically inducible protein
MNRVPVWLRFLLCLSLAAGCSGAGRRDAAITESIRSTMENDPIVHAPDLSITTRAGVVTLEGDVPDEFARLRAIEIVRQTPGVVQVVDRLRALPAGMPAAAPILVPRAVRASMPLSSTRREPKPDPAVSTRAGSSSVPELVPDRTGEIELGDAAAAPAERAPANGEPSPERESAREDLAPDGPDAPAAAPALDLHLAMSEHDAAISVDVRAKVEEVAPTGRIQVATRHGVVTLSGVVDTELEKSQALEAARAVPGVERVEDRLLVLRS